MTTTTPPRPGPGTLIDRLADHRALVPLRLGIGPLVVAQLWPVLRAAQSGVVSGEVFTMPYLSWYPAPPPGLLVPLLWLAMAAALSTSIGWWTRPAAATTAVAFAWWMFASDLRYHHNRGLLLLLIVLIALTRSGGSFSLDALVGHRRRRPVTTVGLLWPLLLMRFELALMYLVSGSSKLLDPDWVGGTVTWLRVGRAAGPGPRHWLVALATDPSLHRFLGPAVVAAEVFIGVGLLVPRLRTAAIWLAIPFHVAIELTSQVQTFSYAALLALVVWVTPTTERHRVTLPGGLQGARWTMRWLDWTGRLAVVATEGEGEGEPILVSPDGAVRRGGEAVTRAIALLPLLFWPATVLSALRALTGGDKPVGRRRSERV